MSRSRSFVAAQAIEEFVNLNEWQIGEIRKAISEADRADFATNFAPLRISTLAK